MRLRILSALIVLSIVVLAVLAWTRSTTREASSAGEGGEMAAPQGGEVGGSGMPSIGEPTGPPADPGVAWQVPPRWAEEPATGMRIATYAIPAPASGGEAARCAVYYFGPGQGGGTDANIERWIGEFENPSAPARRVSEVRGLKISRVEVSGTYVAHADPAQGASGPSTGWTLLGAIVEGPNGAVFFKLTGPRGTADPAGKEFDSMLASLRTK